MGEPASDYTLTVGKPNLFKLSMPDGFVLSDGSNVYTYKKSDNSYSEVPYSDGELAKFEKKSAVFGWAAFFPKSPVADITVAVPKPPMALKGMQVTPVDVSLKDGKTTGTIFVDPSTGLTAGFSLKTEDKQYLAIASSVTPSNDPPASDLFAFIAPDGSKKVDAAASGGFTQVAELLNNNCMPCHSSSNHKAGVNLTSYQGIVAAVTPGDAAGSLLVKSLYGNGVDQMPKGRTPLSADQIKIVEQWITAGAKQE